jgi:hypothetical protein
MNCIKGLESRLADDPDCVDDEINPGHSGNPIAHPAITREIGKYKLALLSSGRRCSACRNYNITSAAQSLMEMPTYETGGTRQQDSHAGSIGP